MGMIARAARPGGLECRRVLPLELRGKTGTLSRPSRDPSGQPLPLGEGGPQGRVRAASFPPLPPPSPRTTKRDCSTSRRKAGRWGSCGEALAVGQAGCPPYRAPTREFALRAAATQSCPVGGAGSLSLLL